MTDTTIISILLTANAGLVTAIVYLFKKGEKRDREYRNMLTDLINRNNLITERTEKVLCRVEELLKNWRAR